MSTALKHYLLRNGAAISILLNTLTGGASNQSFSARNWEWKRNGRFNIVWFIDALTFGIEDDHCMNRWIYWMHLNRTGEFSLFNMGKYNERPRQGDFD